MQMIAIYGALTQDQANTYGLVLTSYGLPYSVRRTSTGWEIWVSEEIHDTAMELIDRYLEENPHLPILDAPTEPRVQKTFSGVWVSLLLLAVFVGMPRTASKIDAFGAVADRILDGEWYRTVTALFLHADAVHLAGNIAGIAIFGTAVCNLVGVGTGWLMILLSGLIGNGVNAWIIGSPHTAIGASTAVFGAVGILAAQSFFRRLAAPRLRSRAWLPVAGGLALLALLGTGVHSDVTAHLFGFLAGMLLGYLGHRYGKTPPSKKAQQAAMGLAVAIAVFSWLAAM